MLRNKNWFGYFEASLRSLYLAIWHVPFRILQTFYWVKTGGSQERKSKDSLTCHKLISNYLTLEMVSFIFLTFVTLSLESSEKISHWKKLNFIKKCSKYYVEQSHCQPTEEPRNTNWIITICLRENFSWLWGVSLSMFRIMTFRKCLTLLTKIKMERFLLRNFRYFFLNPMIN